MPAQLTVHPAERASRRAILDDGVSLDIGRDPGCDLHVDEPRISKRHARLEWNGRAWTLRDLGSKNGSSVNGLSAAGQVLAHGDWLSFGGVPARFELLNDAQAGVRRAQRELRAATSVRLRQRLSEAQGDAETLLARLLESAREVVAGERGFVLLTNADGSLRVGAASGYDGATQARTFQGSAAAVRRVLEGGSALILSDVRDDAQLAARASIVSQGVCALACLPLRIGERVAGVLYVDNRRAGTVLDELDAEILEGLAEHAGVLLGASEVQRRLQELRSAALAPTAVADALERQLTGVRIRVEPA